MKILYYEKSREFRTEEHIDYFLECYYVPEEKTILYNTEESVKYDLSYLITTKKEHITEAEEILKGNIPDLKNIKFFEIKEFEYNSTAIKELIKNLKTKKDLDKKIDREIYNLNKKVEDI